MRRKPARSRCISCVIAATLGNPAQTIVPSRGATTQSLVMRSKSGTVRIVNARHRLEKLREY